MSSQAIRPHQRPALARGEEIVEAGGKPSEHLVQRRDGTDKLGIGKATTSSLMSKTITGTAFLHAAINMGVLRGVLMPLRTVGLGFLPYPRPRVVGAGHVDSVTDGLKVLGPDTVPSTAKVVHFDTRGKGSVQTFVNPSVGTNGAATVIGTRTDAEHAIPIRVDEGSPQPTGTGFLDFRPEPLLDGNALLERTSFGHVAMIPRPVEVCRSL